MDQNNNLISVIIPFYSTLEGRLIKAITSVLNQTYTNLEIIVVDDCSPVSAEKELKDINSNKLKIVNHVINKNGAIARNTGIEIAKGTFIALLDYDDIWYPDKLEDQFKLYKNNESKYDKLVIYSKCKIIEGKRTFIRPHYQIDEKQTVGEYLFKDKQLIQTSGIFLPTIIAEEVLFDDLKRHQDYQFCLSLEKFGCKFLLLDKVSYEFIQISKLNDYTFSSIWLNKYKIFLTTNAIIGFKKLVILRSMLQHKHYYKAFKYSLRNGLIFNFLITNIKMIVKSILFKKASK